MNREGMNERRTSEIGCVWFPPQRDLHYRKEAQSGAVNSKRVRTATGALEGEMCGEGNVCFESEE